MLTLFNKFSKKDERIQVEDDSINPEVQIKVEPALDEASLKKSIAAKLQGYRPIEREANFTGPKYFSGN